ncbi:MAG TPA: FAD:protein FMN transferase [Sedimentisphaerales bacterium]|nr:FAD:protein FMN transferase [Sedimentisphaerales bacterium]
MTPIQPEIPFTKAEWDSVCGTHRFSHEAMATTFEVIIQHEDGSYARQAALAAFNELDRLEREFSRFIENSDVSRINNITANQSLVIGLETFGCLQVAARMYDETRGAFDITVGLLFDAWLSEDKTLRSPSRDELNLARQHTGTHLLKLDGDEHTVELLTDRVKIDLGGIGKGYAADRMAELLRDWGVDIALVHGGYSSVLALAPPHGTKGWPVTLTNPADTRQTLACLLLQDRALSGSGLQQGRHIIDPRSAGPVEGRIAAWACAPDAATADALSTAFMVMTPDEINHYCLGHCGTLAMVVVEEGGQGGQKQKILRYGPWEQESLFKQ